MASKPPANKSSSRVKSKAAGKAKEKVKSKVKARVQAKAVKKVKAKASKSSKSQGVQGSSVKSAQQNKADKAGEFAKSIWLAGLGAYGKVFDAATDAPVDDSNDADSFFEGLVERGQKLEKKARDQIKPLPKPDMFKQKMAIDERIEKMRNYLNTGVESAKTALREKAKDEEIERLKQRVSNLEEKLKASTKSEK